MSERRYEIRDHVILRGYPVVDLLEGDAWVGQFFGEQAEARARAWVDAPELLAEVRKMWAWAGPGPGRLRDRLGRLIAKATGEEVVS